MVKPGNTKSKPGAAFWAAFAVILVGGVAVLGWLSGRTQETVVQMDPSLPAVAVEGYTYGDAKAPVEIIEFGDYECPACGQFAAVTMPDIKSRLVQSGRAKFTFYDFPLDMHRNAWAAALAAACANDQGKFWEMHERIYMGQLEWNTQATSTPKKIFAGYAKQLGLDGGAWETCYDERRHLAKIQASRKEAEARRLPGTPAVIVDGRLITRGLSYDLIAQLVDSAYAAKTAAAPAGN